MSSAAQKKATKKKVSTAKEWKKSTPQGGDLEVPSGNVCRVKKPDGMRVFMAQGIIPNSLLPIIKEAVDDPEHKHVDVDSLAESVIANPAMLEDMFGLVDAITVATVLEPKVTAVPTFTEEHAEKGMCSKEEVGQLVPPDHELRDEDVLYVDEVDSQDKMFIFNFAVGGSRDLERFRSGQAEGLAALEAK